jgi:hypothetical protein
MERWYLRSRLMWVLYYAYRHSVRSGAAHLFFAYLRKGFTLV